MADVVDAATRSRMMAGIKGSNTRPEIQTRKYLHARGYRFRLHRKDLPGRPDLVLPKYRAAVFVHGCFWHAHEGCRFFRIPSTRRAFWEDKLLGNRKRDERDVAELLARGWRVAVIWECGLRDGDSGLESLVAWLAHDGQTIELATDRAPLLRDVCD